MLWVVFVRPRCIEQQQSSDSNLRNMHGRALKDVWPWPLEKGCFLSSEYMTFHGRVETVVITPLAVAFYLNLQSICDRSVFVLAASVGNAVICLFLLTRFCHSDLTNQCEPTSHPTVKWKGISESLLLVNLFLRKSQFLSFTARCWEREFISLAAAPWLVSVCSPQMGGAVGQGE